MTSLFDDAPDPQAWQEQLAPRSFVLRHFALPYVAQLLPALTAVLQASPWRHMCTPGGWPMSVASSNCGALGWISDRHGYRYSPIDPTNGHCWPPMPTAFLQLAQAAAAAAGFEHFTPDACLINRYQTGAKMALHQDKDEQDFDAPIVSVSLGVPAIFLFGGQQRSDKPLRVALLHGDVVVWGGPDRLRYHGVLPLKAAQHRLLGTDRINFTLRKAG